MSLGARPSRTCLLIVLIFPQKVRWIFGFWLVSLLLILFLGGISRVVAFSVFLIFAICLFEIGGVLARAVLVKDSRKISKDLVIYDSRTVPGTELLINGGFEEYKEPVRKHWSLEGSAQWSSTGISSVRLNPGSGLSQTIPLPPSLKKILVTINSKRLTSFEDPTLTVSLLWKEPDSRIFHQDKSIFTVGVDWKTEKMVRNVPSKAAWVELYVYHSGGNALILVDEVHMYAQ